MAQTLGIDGDAASMNGAQIRGLSEPRSVEKSARHTMPRKQNIGPQTDGRDSTPSSLEAPR